MKHQKKIGKATTIPVAGLGQQQQGVALAMSLMVLVVLTILGISGMKTGLLQSRMSVNAQESATAFQAAESAVGANIAANLAAAKAGASPFNMSSTVTQSNYKPDGSTTVVVTRQFEGTSPPPRSDDGSSVLLYQVANYRYQATSSTVSGARSIVSQGMYRITNK